MHISNSVKEMFCFKIPYEKSTVSKLKQLKEWFTTCFAL